MRYLQWLACAGFLCLGAATVHAQWSSCFSASAQPTCVSVLTGSAHGSTPAEAIEEAAIDLTQTMVGHAGYNCGPCRIPEACYPSVTNLTGDWAFVGPEEEDGQWVAAAAFSGCYHIVCSGC